MINGLFIIMLLELFIGGSGRLIQLGPLTLRMVLFGTCLIVFAFSIYLRLRRLDGQRLAFGLLLFYLLVHIFGLIIGAVNGANTGDMFTEFQHSLYWLAAPFFAMVLQSPAMVQRASVVVRVAGVVLAVAYFMVLALLLFGKMSILEILPLLHDSGEVVVRGDNFLFYKGFLYLGIAVVFFVGIRGRFSMFLAGLVWVALVLTLTRGFLLSTSVAVLLMLATQVRRIAATFALIMIMIAAFVILVYVPSQKVASFSENRSESTNQRTHDLVAIIENMTPKTFLIGEGYAAEENDRQEIENSFLWAQWKLGVMGPVFWMTPLFLCAYFYLKIPDRRHHRIATAYFFGTVVVYVETLTNPFLNNPIGLSYVLVAIFSLRTLSKQVRLEGEPMNARLQDAP
jgi:hypothetical protein